METKKDILARLALVQLSAGFIFFVAINFSQGRGFTVVLISQ
jgi:hypothetical protein